MSVSPGSAPIRNSALRLTRRGLIQSSAAAALIGVQGVSAQDATPAASPVADAGSVVRVTPRPGTVVASPLTQLSFRGVSVDQLGPIEVKGEASGWHPGALVEHSDGNGVSWMPDFAFHPGEAVSVRTRLEIADADDGDFSFTCSRPTLLTAFPTPSSDADETEARSYRSRPGLRPTAVTATPGDRAGDLAPGYFFISPKRGPGVNGSLIVDDTGEPVYFFPTEVAIEQTYDFKVVVYQGEPHLIWWQGDVVRGHGFGHWVIKNNAYETVQTIRIGNGYYGGDLHDIAFTDRDTVLVGTYSTIVWDLASYGGTGEDTVIDNIIQEIDLANGAVWREWHCLDEIGLDESQIEPAFEEDSGAFDYFHFNSVAEDDDGNFIVSARNTSAIYKIDAQSGAVIWRLGGTSSDFAQDEETITAWQHDARPHPDGTLSIFDNSADPPVREVSRGLILRLDTDGMRATVERQIEHPDKISAGSQGNFQLLGNGNAVIGWGAQPRVSEFNADGELLLDLAYPEGRESYRAYKFEWTGMPSERPALAIDPQDDGGVSIAVSWNGATEVASWQPLSGDDADALAPLGEPVPKRGFETQFTLVQAPTVLALDALDAAGNAIGRTRIVDLTAG